jgi:hypothetical protein
MNSSGTLRCRYAAMASRCHEEMPRLPDKIMLAAGGDTPNTFARSTGRTRARFNFSSTTSDAPTPASVAVTSGNPY